MRFFARDRGPSHFAGGRLMVGLLAVLMSWQGASAAWGAVGDRLAPGEGWITPTSRTVQSLATQSVDPMAIARWDVIPGQVFSESFNAGVVAFHIYGIDRVEFAVDGGPWVAVREMTFNPSSGVVEYWAVLQAEDFAQTKDIELHAVAYPKRGIPRVLEPIRLRVNKEPPTQPIYVSSEAEACDADGSEKSPYSSLTQAFDRVAMNGTADAVIFLLPGVYGIPRGGLDAGFDCRELTISSPPGTDRRTVRIEGGGEIRARSLQLRSLTIHKGGLTTGGYPTPRIWFNDCVLSADNRFESVGFASGRQWTGGVYATDCLIESVANGLGGAMLQRNVHLKGIQSDAFQNQAMVLNCTIDDIEKRGTEAHPDVIQLPQRGELDNKIYYGVKATNVSSQGIFAGGDEPANNIAFVNVLIEMNPEKYVSQWHRPGDHLLFWNVTLLNRPTRFFGTPLTHLSIRNSVFFRLGGDSNGLSDGVIYNNHFIEGGTYGLQATKGDPGWDETQIGEYRPGKNSPLVGRVRRPIIPVDVNGVEVTAPACIGAVQR